MYSYIDTYVRIHNICTHKHTYIHTVLYIHTVYTYIHTVLYVHTYSIYVHTHYLISRNWSILEDLGLLAVHNFGDLTDENTRLLLPGRVPDETGQVLGQLEGTKVVVLQNERVE